jgi:hypothetical protein
MVVKFPQDLIPRRNCIPMPIRKEAYSLEHFPGGHNKTMDNKDSRREKVSKGVMGLVVGLSLMVAGIGAARQLHIVWNIWPSTDGETVGGTVQEILQVPYSRGGMPIYRYSPKVEFRFTVGGRAYTATAPSVYTADTYEKAAANLSRLYGRGTHHPIRYNPANPEEIQFGVIPFGALAYAWLMLIGGVALTVAGLGWLRTPYPERAAIAPAQATRIPDNVLPLPDRARRESLESKILCPNCHRPVRVTEDSCPNCLKSLRAA